MDAEEELAALCATYDDAVEVYRLSGSEEDKAKKDDLAAQVYAKRSALRQVRESQSLATTNGDGVARPAPVDSTTEVSR